MSDAETGAIVEHESAVDFEATVALVTAAISGAGLIVFGRFDHDARARDVGLEMPKTVVISYGHPKGGTPVMVAAPLAALDLPLRVLVREREDGQTVIGFHPILAVLRQLGAPDNLAARLQPAQQLLLAALSTDASG